MTAKNSYASSSLAILVISVTDPRRPSDHIPLERRCAFQWPVSTPGGLFSRVAYFDQALSEIGAHTVGMTDLSWIEHLRCPRCGKTGDAELYEISRFNNGFRHIPDGFKVVLNQYGGDFCCEACAIPVELRQAG
jgi:hypothetical protein